MFFWSTYSETHGYDDGKADLATIQAIATKRNAMVVLWNNDVNSNDGASSIGHVEPNGKVEWL